MSTIKEVSGITNEVLRAIQANKKPLTTLKTSVLVGLKGNIVNIDIEYWDNNRIKSEIEKNSKLSFLANEPFTVKGIIEVSNLEATVVAYMNSNLLAMLTESGIVTFSDDFKTYSFDNSEVEFSATAVRKTNVLKLTKEQLQEFGVRELKEMLDNRNIDYKSSDNKETLIEKLM